MPSTIDMAIYDFSFSMTFDYILSSQPVWFQDHGSVTLSVQSASVELTSIPVNNKGQLQINLVDSTYNIQGFDCNITSYSDIGKAS